MRIVAGDQRGVRLTAPPGRILRPTSDRVRESVFNILAHGALGLPGLDAPGGARVLDAFAGTGALGLEALSRGARHVVFMENGRIALRGLRENIDQCKRQDDSTIREKNVLGPPPATAPVDVAFLDPPYRQNLVAPALGGLRRGSYFLIAAATAPRRLNSYASTRRSKGRVSPRIGIRMTAPMR